MWLPGAGVGGDDLTAKSAKINAESKLGVLGIFARDIPILLVAAWPR